MSNTSQIISIDNIIHHSGVSSRKRVLEQLSQILAFNTSATTTEKIFRALFNRERLGSTGLGKGVLIPHVRLPDITHSISAMMTLKKPVDFDTVDNEPIDIIFVLLVPEGNEDCHHRRLIRLATLFRNVDTCKKIRAAVNAKEIFNLLLFIDS